MAENKRFRAIGEELEGKPIRKAEPKPKRVVEFQYTGKQVKAAQTSFNGVAGGGFAVPKIYKYDITYGGQRTPPAVRSEPDRIVALSLAKQAGLISDATFREAMTATVLAKPNRPGHDRAACETVDCSVCDANTPKSWTTAEGTKLLIRKMTDSHLFNAAKYIAKRDLEARRELTATTGDNRYLTMAPPIIVRSPAYRALVNELRRRKIRPPKLFDSDEEWQDD